MTIVSITPTLQTLTHTHTSDNIATTSTLTRKLSIALLNTSASSTDVLNQ
jgi:hypothetical protein